MRKEFRVGFGIGGVLLAVFVVAIVVRSHTRQKAQDTNKVAIADPDGGSVTDGASSKPDPLTSTSSDPLPLAPITPPTPDSVKTDGGKADPVKPEETTDPFTKAGDVWDKALSEGTLPTTVTPGQGRNSERMNGERFSEGNGGILTPRSFPSGGMGTSEGGSTSHMPPASAGRPKTHTVAQGETFSSIARKVYGNSRQYLLIVKANPNVDPERLRPGTTINIPDAPSSADHAERHTASHSDSRSSATAGDSRSEYVVKSGDSLYRISMRLYATASKVDALYNMNKDRIGPDRQRLKLGMALKLPEPPTSNGR